MKEKKKIVYNKQVGNNTNKINKKIDKNENAKQMLKNENTSEKQDSKKQVKEQSKKFENKKTLAWKNILSPSYLFRVVYGLMKKLCVNCIKICVRSANSKE